MVVVSPNTTFNPVLPLDANLQSTAVNASPARETTSTTAQDSANTTRFTVTTDPDALSPPTVYLPDTPMSSPAASPRAGVPPVEVALHGAQEAITTISNILNTWEDALERIK